MQISPAQQLRRRGGRSSTPQYRQTQDFSQEFSGLEDNVSRYDLLLLVKRTGKAAGFTPRMIAMLDYYMAYTRDCDWEEGSRPIVYQSLTRTALDLGISERQVQKLERQLADHGAITWNDAGNCRRYGLRDEKTGKLRFAYGVDLSPLASLRAELQETLHEKQLREAAWLDTKRQISWHRAQIRAMLDEALQLMEEGRGGFEAEILTVHQAQAETLAKPIRTYMTLEALRDLLQAHSALYAVLKTALDQHAPSLEDPAVSQKRSPADEQKFAHKETTNQSPSNKLDTGNHSVLNEKGGVRQRQHHEETPSGCGETPVPEASQGRGEMSNGTQTAPSAESRASVNANPEAAPQLTRLSCGLEHLNWKQIMQAASDRFMDHLVRQTAGMQRPILASDCVRAAYDLSRQLGIAHDAWIEACTAIGDQAAAICIILIDHAVQRPENAVRKPTGYFRAMIGKAGRGELHLHKSIFGLTKGQGRGNMTC